MGRSGESRTSPEECQHIKTMLRIERDKAPFPSSGVYQRGPGYAIIEDWREQNGRAPAVRRDSDNPADHPGPHCDSKLKDAWSDLYYADDYLFGFSDLAQLRAWFFDDLLLRALLDAGYVIHEYKTGDRYHEGYTQCICHEDDMILVGPVDPFQPGPTTTEP